MGSGPNFPVVFPRHGSSVRFVHIIISARAMHCSLQSTFKNRIIIIMHALKALEQSETQQDVSATMLSLKH